MITPTREEAEHWLGLFTKSECHPTLIEILRSWLLQRSALEAMEWAPDAEGHISSKACPACYRLMVVGGEFRKKHAPGCPVARALGRDEA